MYFDSGGEGAPTESDIVEMVVRPLLRYDRMSMVPDVDGRDFRPSRFSGEGGEDARPTDLIRTIRIDGDESSTHRTIVEHCQDSLKKTDLPWWEILVVRNTGSGSSACVLRVHHVIGDGLALVAAFNKIFTNKDGGPLKSPLDSKKDGNSRKTGEEIQPKKNKHGFFATAWSLARALFHVLTLGATKYDDDTAFSKMNNSKLKHSGRREAVIFPAVPLDFVKKLKTAAGEATTVNDVLVSVMSQAIRDYCLSRNDPIFTGSNASDGAKKQDLRCRALLPVGFPRPSSELDDTSLALRNIWAMASCDIGLGCSDMVERLAHVRKNTRAMKAEPIHKAYVQLQVQNVLGPYVPTSVGQQTVFDTFSRHSLVLTNVPGPSEHCVFAGKVVDRVQLFFDNLLTQVDLISYAGTIYGNMVYDADELPGAEAFGKLYAGALVALAASLGVEVPPEVEKAAAA